MRAHTWRDLTDGGRVPAIALVTVGRLDEDGAVAEALCEDLPSNVVQPHASPWRDGGQTGLGWGWPQGQQRHAKGPKLQPVL